MHSHAGNVVSANFDLSRMQSSPDTKVQWTQRIPNGQCALDGPPRTVECGHEAVADRLHLTTSEPLELRPHRLIMSIEEVTPPVVSELACQLGGADDVSE